MYADILPAAPAIATQSRPQIPPGQILYPGEPGHNFGMAGQPLSHDSVVGSEANIPAGIH